MQVIRDLISAENFPRFQEMNINLNCISSNLDISDLLSEISEEINSNKLKQAIHEIGTFMNKLIVKGGQLETELDIIKLEVKNCNMFCISSEL